MEVTAKAVMPGHKHREKGMILEFDHRGLLTTSDDDKVAMLLKHNGKPGFWAVVKSNAGWGMQDNLRRKGRPWLITEALKLGYNVQMDRHPKHASDGELLDFIKEMRK